MFLNEMNRKKNFHKSKKLASTIKSKKQHIEYSDSSQEDDDDYASNNVTFQITTKKDTFEGTIATDVVKKKKTTIIFDVVAIYKDSDSTDYEESESDKSYEEEPSTKDIQKAYQEMYDNQIKVCNVNKSLRDKMFKLVDENKELKYVMFNLKNFVKKK